MQSKIETQICQREINKENVDRHDSYKHINWILKFFKNSFLISKQTLQFIFNICLGLCGIFYHYITVQDTSSLILIWNIHQVRHFRFAKPLLSLSCKGIKYPTPLTIIYIT